MGQIKVHEIATKFGLSNREVITMLREAGFNAASNLSVLDDSCLEIFKPSARKAAAEKLKAVMKTRTPRKPAAPRAKTAPAKKAEPAAKKPAAAVIEAPPPPAPPAAEVLPAKPAAAPAPAAPAASAATAAPTAPAAPAAASAAPAAAKRVEPKSPAAPSPGAGASAATPVAPAARPSAPPSSSSGETPAHPAAAHPATPQPSSPAAGRPASAPPPAPFKPAAGPAAAPPRTTTPPKPVASRPQEMPRPSAPPPRPQGPLPGRTGSPPPRHQPGPRHAPPPPRSGPPAQSRPAPRPSPPPPPPPPVIPAVLKPLTMAEGSTVRELAEKMSVKAGDVLKRLLTKGVMATINLSLSSEMATELAKEFGWELSLVSFEDAAEIEEQETIKGTGAVARPPVVTIMGHVDHGKTTLLDAIRQSNVVATEHGGITQHIGAYMVRTHGRGITFLDTPGHEAFTLMRARGAQVTDVVVLVVAADDGVMPQTTEAISHAKAAGVPIVVAINKIDKPEAKPDRVRKELADHGLLVEDWGGDVVSVQISAKQKKGLEELLDMILLVADLKDLKSDPSLPASGTVLESRLDKSRGPVATVLVQQGSLKVGDAFIAGSINGKVRALFDDLGERLKEATPSVPAEVLGLQGVPSPGDRFKVITEEWKARQIGAYRQQKQREEQLQKSSRLTLDHLFQKIQQGEVKELNLIVKADVQGSIEALTQTLDRLSNPKVKLRFIHTAAGAIAESDVLLASSSNAIIIGFNVRPDQNARVLAEREGVDIRLHSVIYEVADEIRRAMEGLLEPTFQEVQIGRAEVRDTFKVPKVGVVAGSYVLDGRMVRNADVRLLRDNVVIYQGKIISLKRFKDDVGEVKSGYECGLAISNFNDLKVGDIIEAFKVEKVAPKEMVT